MEKPVIQVKRRYTELSEKETDEAVNVIADLIVNYSKRMGKVINDHECVQQPKNP